MSGRYQIMGNLNPPAFLKAYGLDPNAHTSSRDEAYELIRAEMIKYSAAELEQKNMEHGVSLTAGKQTYPLDLTRAEDKKKLHSLKEGADVIIQAFRLRSLERKSFGLNDLLKMANKRGKGIVYIDLDCYGPDGYYAERPGFQQIADAATGCSYVCGKAYGFEEGVSVLPPLPIADMLSSAVGVIDAMLALRDRAKHGGSYHATVALTAVDAVQLVEEVEELLIILCDAWKKH
ncbi:hypothetical protein DV737_g5460, partial [Chaetothyriales sp. CBS 132003]